MVVLYNGDSDTVAYAANTTDLVYQVLDGITTWPTEAVDGFYLDFDAVFTPVMGAFDRPFRDMDEALDATRNGTKLRLMPGSPGPWSGVITQRTVLDAPFGTAILGQ